MTSLDCNYLLKTPSPDTVILGVRAPTYKLGAPKVLHSMWQQIWKTQQWPQDWKRSVFTPVPKKGNTKECSNYHTIAPILHASKVKLKILQVSLQEYVNQELPDVQAEFRKGRGMREQTANICWIIEKAREFEKNIYFCLTDCAKALTVWITTNCGKFLKRWEYQTPAKPVCRSRSNSKNRSWNNGRGPNWERSALRLYTVTLLI